MALQFWQTLPLPVPHPTIPPGYALAGKPAYLVTGGTTAPPAWSENTPLGPLRIQAVGEYFVDWGDGTSPALAGPYDVEGQAWPVGGVSHTYDVVGVDTVTVDERWTARWSLAGATGSLGQLQTQATIVGLPVRQVEAVLTNG
ncbi:MAG: hypothetical protein ACYC1D_04200 [Acidimicrobiales bacterium]